MKKENTNNLQNISQDKNPSSTTQHKAAILQWTSPLPPAEILLSYEKIQPGLINEIIALTKTQSEHRRKLEIQQFNMEEKHLDSQIKHLERRDREAKLGQIYGFILGISAIVAGSIVASYGYQWSGSIIGISGIGGIIATFIHGRKHS